MKKFGLLVLSAAAVVMFAGDLSAMQNQGGFVPFKPTLRGREASLKRMAEFRARQAAAKTNKAETPKKEEINKKGQETKVLTVAEVQKSLDVLNEYMKRGWLSVFAHGAAGDEDSQKVVNRLQAEAENAIRSSKTKGFKKWNELHVVIPRGWAQDLPFVKSFADFLRAECEGIVIQEEDVDVQTVIRDEEKELRGLFDTLKQ